MEILFTGGAVFIGSHVTHRCIQKQVGAIGILEALNNVVSIISEEINVLVVYKAWSKALSLGILWVVSCVTKT